MCNGDPPGVAGSSTLIDRGDVANPAAELSEDIVIANRILAAHGVVDAFGHVSVRHPNDPNHYLLARNMAPALVEIDDLIEFDLASNPVNAKGCGVYLERFIHGEIYRQRPDVMAVVHSHAAAVVPFGVVPSSELRPLWHMSAFLPQPVPVFDIRTTSAGDSSDLLIRSIELGQDLAAALGDDSVILMRGHGATVVGSNLRQAVFRAVYTQVNAQLQMQAHGLGAVNFLTPGEAASASISVGGQDRRAWDLWAHEVTGK